METVILGSLKKAKKYARLAFKNIPAYSKFSHSVGASFDTPFKELPISDKGSYIQKYTLEELAGTHNRDTFTLFRSSGSSGHPAYWPQLRSTYRHITLIIKKYLESVFQIHKKSTRVIIGLALGSWVGGDCFSWFMKNLSLDLRYPFSVFSPGNRHDEIIEMIENTPNVDQFIVMMCPSAIGHLHLKSKQKGIELPHHKIRYWVLGEAFPEVLRTSLKELSGHPAPILSLFGSADTGTLGVESLASSALRSLLSSNDALRKSLGIETPVPHFFHFTAAKTIIETVNNELIVTRWQGIPLIRYNLHDRAHLYKWSGLVDLITRSPLVKKEEQHLVKMIQRAGLFCGGSWLYRMIMNQPSLGDIIAISGRADACLLLSGTNLSEFMIHDAVHGETLSTWLTGAYHAHVDYEEGRQFLFFELEVREAISITQELEDNVYFQLIQELGRVQPEFLQDWQHVYSNWDNDRQNRILKLNLVHWPGVSHKTETQIKHRGIR